MDAQFPIRAAQHDVLVGMMAEYYSQLGRRWEVFPAKGPTKVDMMLMHMDRPEIVVVDVKAPLTKYPSVAVQMAAAERYNSLLETGTDVQIVSVIDRRPVVAAWSWCWRYRQDPDGRPGNPLNGSGTPFTRIPHRFFSGVDAAPDPDWWDPRWLS